MDLDPKLDALLSPWLTADEGKRSKLYVDTVGKWSIGIGRNLTDVGLSEDEIQYLFANDKRRAYEIAVSATKKAVFDTLTLSRQAVLCDMAFNLGEKLYQFKATLRDIERGDYKQAAYDMEHSLWASQVGDRAKRLASIMSGDNKRHYGDKG